MAESYEMSDDEKQEIIEEFLAESDQYLQSLNDCLLKAEELIKGGQTVEKDDINLMFRAAHTIKGTASFIDLTTISHLTHEMETVLDRIRNDQMDFTVEAIDVLFAAFDSLSALLERLKTEGDDQGDVSESLEKIRQILSGEAPAAAEEPVAAEKPAEPAVEEPQEVVPEESEASSESDEELEKYWAAFIEDTQQNIERFDEILLNMEKGDFKPDYLNELFRISHTIKGSSGIVKRRDLEMLSHKMEDILSGMREKEEPPAEHITTLLFKGIDWIKETVNEIQSGKRQERDPGELVQEFEKLLAAEAASPAGASEVSAPADQGQAPAIDINALNSEQAIKLEEARGLKQAVYNLTIAVSEKCPAKSMKAMLAKERLSKEGIIIAMVPEETAIDDSSTAKVSIQFLYSTSESQEGIPAFVSIDEIELVSLDKIDMAEEKPAEPAVAEPKAAAAAPAAAAKPQAAQKPVKKEAAKEKQSKSAPVEVTSMRVDVRKLDNLMNLAGELVITRARFSQLLLELRNEVSSTRQTIDKFREIENSLMGLKMKTAETVSSAEANGGQDRDELKKMIETIGQKFQDTSRQTSTKLITEKIYNMDEATRNLEKLSSDIQNGVMQTRMVPIEGVFSRFKRLVRDIAKEIKKDVKLDIYGEDTELDKKITDELGDPLTHMIRNAVDHGLENTEERKATDKPQQGTVTLGAMHKGNNICIEISDDGKGLDPDKIANKAFEKEIITEDALEQMSDREKMGLIFAPGFSTAEQVTGLSGRGVGMDVVKKMIESLNGTVDIESEMGQGTSFKLKIPLTLAIIQALLVVIDNEVFALPLESVSEIVKVMPDEVYRIEGTATIKLRDHTLSLVELEKVIQIEQKKIGADDERRVVVITDGENQVGICVDELIGEDEIVIKSLPVHFTNVIGISGASILGDGRICLILDVGAIIKEAQ